MESIEHTQEVAVKRKSKPRDVAQRLDPRRLNFLEYYFKPDSPTFNNGLQSALRAGYSQKYAEQLIARDYPWLRIPLESVSTQHLVEKARGVLQDAVEGKLDSEGKPFYKYKSAEFVASRADKDFTEKQQIDHTSGGLPIQESVLKAMMKAYGEEES